VYSTVADHVCATESNADDTVGAFNREITEIAQHRDGIESILSGVCAAAGSKRKYLQSTVSALSDHAEEAIRQSVQAVDRTSTTASGILSAVSEASSSMDRSTADAMDLFVGFLDNHGDALSVTLQSHFLSIHDHCQQQQQSMVDLRTAAEQHREAIMGAVVESTGDTPKKVLESSHRSPFKRTRNHSIIKHDARRLVLLDSEGVSYDKASREIASRSSLVLPADNEDDNSEQPQVSSEISPIISEVQREINVYDNGMATNPLSVPSALDDSIRKSSNVCMDGTDNENMNPNIINENMNPNIMQRQKISAKPTTRTRSRALPATKGTRSRPEAGHTEATHDIA